MKLLVTGGAGFLGHFLRLHLPRAGRSIVWLRDRRPLFGPADAPDLTRTHSHVGDDGGSFDCVDLDLGDARHPGWGELARRGPFTAVVHAAAMASPVLCRKEPEQAWAVNVLATERLGRLARDWGARFVHVSTDVIFGGDAPPYDEHAPPRPGTVYGRTKAEAEERLRILGGALVILRPSLLYRLRGTGPSGEEREWVLAALRRGEAPRLYRNQIRNPLLADDLARLVARVVEATTPPSCLHVGGRQAMSRYAFGVALTRHFGLDPSALVAVDSRPDEDVEPAPLDLTLDLTRLAAFLGHVPVGAEEALGYNGADGLTEEEA